jgi:hypothetical protein
MDEFVSVNTKSSVMDAELEGGLKLKFLLSFILYQCINSTSWMDEWANKIYTFCNKVVEATFNAFRCFPDFNKTSSL